MTIDPVCGMEIDERTAAHKAVYEGETYYFCSQGCLQSFEENPRAYVSGAPYKE